MRPEIDSESPHLSYDNNVGRRSTGVRTVDAPLVWGIKRVGMETTDHASGGNGLDTAFKLFEAVAIAIAVFLTAAVILLTDPFGAFVTTSPAVVGTALFTVLSLAVGYAVYALRARREA